MSELIKKKLVPNWPYILGGIIGLAASYKVLQFSKKSSLKDENILSIELGGTNAKIALIKKTYNKNTQKYNFEILKRFEISTNEPEKTIETLLSLVQGEKFSSIGIASFGPLCLNQSDPNFGSITTTPKPNWGNFKLLSTIKEKTKLERIYLDTDVNSAALGEYKLGIKDSKLE